MPDLTTLLNRFLSVLYGQGSIPADTTGAAGTGVPTEVFTSTTPVSNAGTGETDLITYSLGAAALSADKQKVRVTAWGTCANNANAKTIKGYFGASNVVATAAVTTAAGGWYAQMTITRTGAATQVAGGMIAANNTGAYTGATSPTETLSGAVTIKFTGQSNTAGGDVTQTGMVVEWLP